MNFSEFKVLIEQQNEAFAGFKAANDDQLENIEKRLNRIGMGGGSDPADSIVEDSSGRFSVRVGDKLVPVLTKNEKLSDHYRASRSSNGEGDFSLANYVRGAMGFQNAVVSGPALVPAYVGAEIIDAVRANSVVIEAGSGTINIEGPTNFAKLTGDPTVFQHTEGAEDIEESTPTIVPVEADPKTLVAVIPLSGEVVADSPNLNAVLLTSLAAAFAGKLDSLALAKILADASIPTSSIGQNPAAWASVLAAISEGLAADQRLPAALISSPADFMARAAQQAGDAGWLGKPPALEAMLELYTSSVADGTAIFGDFLRSFAIAVRQELRVEVIRFAKYKSYSHVLVAHARMDGYVLQPGRLFVQQATVLQQ